MPSRAAKFFMDAVSWRWTPCVALITSSLLYVLFAMAVVPSTISFATSAKPAGIEPPEPANALTAPRTERPSARRGIGPSTPPATPVPAAPPTPLPDQPAPPPPPPPQPPEERREEPPAPPPPPPPPPATPPPAAAAEDDDEPDTPPPPPTPAGRAGPLRFLPQLANQGGGAAPPPPPPPPQPEGEH